jgi:predicted dehydrogenase
MRVRIGLLGASEIAPHAIVAPALHRDDVEVVAVAARDSRRAAAFASKFGIPRVCATYEDLLSAPIDVVYVGLPPSAHAAWSIAAARAGKGVLCEKPFALNALEAVTMIDAAKTSGRPLLEAIHYRFHPTIARVRELLKIGVIGRPVSAHVRMTTAGGSERAGFRWNRALGGGVLLDLGCYAVHALRTVFGTDPEVVEAVARVDDGVDTEFLGRVLFAPNVDATIKLSMIGSSFDQELRIVGDEGAVTLPWFAMLQDNDVLLIERKGVTNRETVSSGSTFSHQLDHLVSVIARGATPLTGGADAIANMTILDRLRARSGLA